MSLPLVYFRRQSRCPFPVNRVLFNILYAFSESDLTRSQMQEWWMQARTVAMKHQRAEELRALRYKGEMPPLQAQELQELESEGFSELRPYGKFSTPEIRRDGEVIQVPSLLTNPDLYAQDLIPPFRTLPYYALLQHNAWFADAAYNVFKMIERRLDKFCAAHQYTGQYDSSLLWMLFSGRATNDKFTKSPDASVLIRALGEHLFAIYASTAGPDEVDAACAAITAGITYIERKQRHAPSDV